MFGKVYKNHKLKLTDLVTNDTHASVFESPYWQGKGWSFEGVVKLKESTSELGQTIYEIEGIVSDNESISLAEINDPKFDETSLKVTQRKTKNASAE